MTASPLPTSDVAIRGDKPGRGHLDEPVASPVRQDCRDPVAWTPDHEGGGRIGWSLVRCLLVTEFMRPLLLEQLCGLPANPWPV